MTRTFTLAGLILVPLIISIGQILFKRSSDALRGPDGPLMGLAGSAHFWIALVLYGLATLSWVFIIRDMQIGRAYMFMALSYVYIPLLSLVFLAEAITLMQVLGAIIICAGIVVSGIKA
ncbi:EamA-like transporter family protein [Hoeflea marina]|uniref:EamA-like transporter family protein n=1 Tax=Hoeflea marina TaxID=274592 RepID=A0A317PK73_9HYPH|nr:EamA family transporter [Hoeflea marina]PWW00198.1 EamA-like transporter family protein [Hoeflea marina]